MKKTKILLYSLSLGSIISASTAGVILYSNNMNNGVSKGKYYETTQNFVDGLMNKNRDTIAQYVHTNEATKDRTVKLEERYAGIFPIDSLNPKHGFNVSEKSRYDQLLKIKYILKYNNYKIIPAGNKVLIALSGTEKSTKILNKHRKLVQHGNHFHEVPDNYDGDVSTNQEFNFLDYTQLAKTFSKDEIIWLQNAYFNNGIIEISYNDSSISNIKMNSLASKYGNISINFTKDTISDGNNFADFITNVTTNHMTLDESYISISNLENIDPKLLGDFVKKNAHQVKKMIIGNVAFGLTKDGGYGLPGLMPTSGSINSWKASSSATDKDVKFAIAELYAKMIGLDVNDLSKFKNYPSTEITSAIKNVVSNISKSSDTRGWSTNYAIETPEFAFNDPYADAPFMRDESDYDTWINSTIQKHTNSDQLGIQINEISLGDKPLNDSVTELIKNQLFWEQEFNGGVHEFINSFAQVLAANEDLYKSFVNKVYVNSNGGLNMSAGHMHPGDAFKGFIDNNVNNFVTNNPTQSSHSIYLAQDDKTYFTNLNTFETGLAAIIRDKRDFAMGATISEGDNFTHTISNFLGTNKDFTIKYSVKKAGTKSFTLDPSIFVPRTERDNNYEYCLTKEIFTSQRQLSDFVDVFLKEYTW